MIMKVAKDKGIALKHKITLIEDNAIYFDNYTKKIKYFLDL